MFVVRSSESKESDAYARGLAQGKHDLNAAVRAAVSAAQAQAAITQATPAASAGNLGMHSFVVCCACGWFKFHAVLFP